MGPRSARFLALLRGILLAMVAVLMLTAAGNPGPPSSGTLHSGMEGTKAALVRIELRAAAEIAHIDHTTGEVDISRGRSTVPLGSATGVLTSADGIVATTWDNLAIDESAVAVYAANELFAEEIGVQVVGNGGDPARRGSTPDPYWRPHLQHCYDQVTHCVLFRVPQYHVRTYTSEPGGAMAELLNSPSDPGDVALLRIGGGGGAPTATLAAPGTTPGPDPVVLGFTERPSPEAGPAEIPATVDASTGSISAEEDLAAPLDAGVSGGPVLDRASGEVLGLTGPLQEDGSASLVSADAVRAAMTEADVEPAPSKFDAVFRRGVDHLAAGNQGGAAESSLEEALTYYDSALAAAHLDRARGSSESRPSADAAATGTGTGGPSLGALLPVVVGAVLLLGVVGAVLLRRRRASTNVSASGALHAPEAGSRSASHAVSRPGRSGADDKASRSTIAARADRGRPDSGTAASAERPRSAQRTSRPTAGPVDAGTPPATYRNRSRADDETRAAGALAPRAADGPPPAFCSQCGRPVRPGARFCSGCGQPVG
ncbi:zinc-ribbon domain-containing protein [Kocuria turfanensis]|uniref:zinc-ribbon domain-containing protein n=1 Tax=Kocuria turfanensis TaxID=388357 RepID=UPI004037124E